MNKTEYHINDDCMIIIQSIFFILQTIMHHHSVIIYVKYFVCIYFCAWHVNTSLESRIFTPKIERSLYV